MKMLRGLLIPALALLLSGCDAVLISPAGDIARQQRDLIAISVVLMLIIIIPVIALTLLFAWKYRESNKAAHGEYDPDWNHSTVLELVIWSAPLIIIIALGAITWTSTHKLDPYRPIDQIDASRQVAAGTKPLVVEVVALDWKWLFFYPEQGIATVNEMAAPVDRPIEFHITASTVMNAFFVPSLAGMIYAMPGMETQLHAVMNKTGDFGGISANYSGAGFSDMTFRFHSVSDAEFDSWVAKARAQGGNLSREDYLKLEQPSEREPVHYYAKVAPGLYNAILNRCVESDRMCQNDMMALDRQGGQGIVGAYNVTTSAALRSRLGLTEAERRYVGALCLSRDGGTATSPAGRAL
ncbi:ubiquinol oxidase subunit II [Luteibacter sp. PPL201]|uniref:Ubiquinol oxidase subunit 2 n=1 Tax=Luteibacter sahnii TaxID=3021977 RepID=A0ABT6BDX1_9GAMM|nr:ubiquinol oxidase subunit II [Luteibacter sp. PPL193]MDY1548818.1 ubiquinol oxidase subunit II [Luteibacter sp. PPL193]